MRLTSSITVILILCRKIDRIYTKFGDEKGFIEFIKRSILESEKKKNYLCELNVFHIG